MADTERLIVIFGRDGRVYRMLVARDHVHPGERDLIEALHRDGLGDISWTRVPEDSTEVPNPEWLVRRALGHVRRADSRCHVHRPATTKRDAITVIDLGSI